jgi:microcystin-dependent protein
MVGLPQVPLTMDSMPQHSHGVTAVSNKTSFLKGTPSSATYLSRGITVSGKSTFIYEGQQPKTQTTLSPQVIGPAYTATPQAHNNMMPSVAMQYWICYQGLPPSPPSEASPDVA